MSSKLSVDKTEGMFSSDLYRKCPELKEIESMLVPSIYSVYSVSINEMTKHAYELANYGNNKLYKMFSLPNMLVAQYETRIGFKPHFYIEILKIDKNNIDNSIENKNYPRYLNIPIMKNSKDMVDLVLICIEKYSRIDIGILYHTYKVYNNKIASRLDLIEESDIVISLTTILSDDFKRFIFNYSGQSYTFKAYLIDSNHHTINLNEKSYCISDGNYILRIELSENIIIGD